MSMAWGSKGSSPSVIWLVLGVVALYVLLKAQSSPSSPSPATVSGNLRTTPKGLSY